MDSRISGHYAQERQTRDDLIQKVIGLGKIIDTFIVDRRHCNGAEVHSVTDTAIIIIQNQKTQKLVTELIARPGQLRRLYEKRGQQPPKWLIKKAYQNNSRGYNEI